LTAISGILFPRFKERGQFYAEKYFFQAIFSPRGKLASKRQHYHNGGSKFYE
jgi:hypothetical protein